RMAEAYVVPGIRLSVHHHPAGGGEQGPHRGHFLRIITPYAFVFAEGIAHRDTDIRCEPEEFPGGPLVEGLHFEGRSTCGHATPAEDVRGVEPRRTPDQL